MRDSNPILGVTSVSKRCPACGETYDATLVHVCAAAESGHEDPTEGLKTLDAAPPPPSSFMGPRPGEPEDLVGATLGDRYEMLARLSAGGMGVVYKARHKILNSIVAVKILLKHEEADDQQRFLQEAQLASKITHKNIVYISDYGVLTDGRPYLVMEYLEGPTLSSVLRKSKKYRIDMLRACRIAAQIARGMQAVHDKGIVHRDLKPENIFVLDQSAPSENPPTSVEDFVKIVDFGIAKDTQVAGASSEVAPALPEQMPSAAELSQPPASAQSSGEHDETGTSGGGSGGGGPQGLTKIGASLGTPRYMAPEQVDGKGVEARSDQYALGCILYQMIGGLVPFSGGSSMALLSMHMFEKPKALRTRFPDLDVPESLDALVLRMLKKDKLERFQSMRAVAEALEHEIELLRIKRGEKVALSAGLAALIGGRRGTHVIIRGVKVPLYVAALVGVLAVAGLSTALLFGYRRYFTEPPGLLPGELSTLEARALQVLQGDLNAASAELRQGALAALAQTRDGRYRVPIEAALRDASPSVQAQAADALGQLGDRQALAALKNLLKFSGALPVRLAAAEAMAQLGDEEGSRYIETLLQSDKEEERLRAASLYCARGNKQAVAILSQAVADNKVPAALSQRFLACLSQAGNDSARQKLRAEMTQSSSENALLAAAKLAQLGQEDGRAFLRQHMLKPGPEQLLSARFLSAPDEPQVAELLRGVLRDPRSGAPARVLASEGLGICGQLLDVRLLGKQLDREKEPDVMLGAAASIVRIARNEPGALSEQSMRWAREALADSQWAIRESAATVIGDSAAVDATQLLSRLLKDAHPAVRKSAARALGRRGDEAALLALREALRDGDAAVRLESLRALLRLAKRADAARRQVLADGARSWLTELLQKGSELEQSLSRALLYALGDRGQLDGLRALTRSTSAEVRGSVLEALSRELDVVLTLLSDSVFAVRFTAAQKLAEAGDRRAVPVLREALEQKRGTALLALTLLRKLGEIVELPASLIDELAGGSLAERQSALDAAETLPGELALPLLKRLARDSDATVRLRVAEVAAELPSGPTGAQGLPILRLLVGDSDAAVRARAATLIGSLLHIGAAGKEAVAAATPLPVVEPKSKKSVDNDAAQSRDAGVSASDSPRVESPAAGQGTGTLIVEAPQLVQFSLDHGRWQTAGKQPISVAAGAHEIASLAGVQTIEIKDKQSLVVRVAESPIEKLTTGGIDAFEKKDAKKAQKLLEKANALCSRERKHPQPCVELTVEINFHLGQVHEALDHPSDAMTAYQRVVAATGRGREERRSAAQAAMTRLKPTLGQVVIPKRNKDKCQEVTLYMVPGTHQIEIDGEAQVVKVRAQETVRLGSCN